MSVTTKGKHDRKPDDDRAVDQPLVGLLECLSDVERAKRRDLLEPL